MQDLIITLTRKGTLARAIAKHRPQVTTIHTLPKGSLWPQRGLLLCDL